MSYFDFSPEQINLSSLYIQIYIICDKYNGFNDARSLLCFPPHTQQIAVPRSDEWTRFVRTLAEINENRDDAEELAAQRLAV